MNSCIRPIFCTAALLLLLILPLAPAQAEEPKASDHPVAREETRPGPSLGGSEVRKDGSPVYLDAIVVRATADTNYEIHEKVTPERYTNSAHIQETSPGFKSPYVGPFTGNQVDQVVNGIRSSNALFRSGPNQYYSWVPDSFVRSVSISDGGNVGGTLSRELSVRPTHVGMEYNSALKGFAETASFKSDKFGAALSNIDYGNVQTANGTVPHSAYNQKAFMAEGNWNRSNRTTILYSQSDDIERTDKWNGGMRSTGFQAPAIYTWELQRYIFLNHKLSLESWDLNFGYQKSEEGILDGTKKVHTDLDAYTFNVNYWLNRNLSFYSTNTVEEIMYDNGVVGPDRISHATYATTKQGARYTRNLGPLEAAVSAGMKEVNISGFSGFTSWEGSFILGYKGFFASVDRSSNAPGYASLKQSTTSGRGTSLPNPDLSEETAITYRLGYMANGLYLDIYQKHFYDAITSVTVKANTYMPVNFGTIDVTGGTIGYQNRSLFNTGLGVDLRVELAYGNQSVYGASDGPISKTPFATSYLKFDYMGAYTEWKYSPKVYRPAATDLDDVRVFNNHGGYNVVNIGYRGTYKQFDYRVALDNVFNDDGRVLGSAVDVPARSIVLSAKYRF
jgi:hypothetical protein